MHQSATIASRFTNGNLSWHWRRLLRSGLQYHQFAELNNTRRNVVLFDVADSWAWTSSRYNIFSTAQAWLLITSSDLVPLFVSSMWCTKILMKISNFIWRLNLNRLLTLQDLEARGIFVDRDCCALCDVVEESLDHLFIRCDISYRIWCGNDSYIFVDRDCCALCDVSKESLDHLFIRCDTSYQI
ncbi:uncharacterized protein [Rutidosis leptorrhynchoides]|uniref:uncharacterized protein n=1 Tax=Rutidosis leptorrhynchoides TaxID=125765 RepID=UPI003A994279